LGPNSCFGAPFWEEDASLVASNLVIKELLTERAERPLAPSLETGAPRTALINRDFHTEWLEKSVMAITVVCDEKSQSQK
jgi:hypothetical protein